jgi:putative ABC transport system substrate-binding protein
LLTNPQQGEPLQSWEILCKVLMRHTRLHVLGLQPQVVNAGTLEEYERAFARLKNEGVNGVLLLADPSNVEHAGKIAEFAQQHRLPTAFQLRENVAAGGLMSYGADNNDQFRADQV